MKGLHIIGAGGHGKVIADLAHQAKLHIGGFIDGDLSKLGTEILPNLHVVMHQDPFFERLRRALLRPSTDEPSVAFAFGANRTRLQFTTEFERFSPTLIHPSAVVSRNSNMGNGTHVLARAVVQIHADIGRAVIINTAAVVEHDCVIKDGVHISPNATLAGGVVVESCAWIGASAVVIPGVRVGEDAIVGAGAVVIRDVPARTTVVGNPARVIASPN